MKNYIATLAGLLFIVGEMGAQVPVLIKELGHNSPQQLTDVNGTLYFTASDPEGLFGFELWKSDGTEAGTVLVKDIIPGSDYTGYSYLTNVNGTLYFAIDDKTHGIELWKSDGTADGTTLVKDINPGTVSSNPSNFLAIGDTLYFTAENEKRQVEVWKSDGTEAGTVKITSNLFLSSSGYDPFDNAQAQLKLASLNGVLYFLARDADYNNGLYKSDGKNTGTSLVKSIENVSYTFLYNVNGTLYFAGGSGSFGDELWKSDGTTAGTVMVKDINPGIASSMSSSTNYAANSLKVFPVENTVYFMANDGIHGRELWKTDGTEAGTVMVKDLNYGTANSFILYCTSLDNLLIFRGEGYQTDNSTNGQELWKSDGTGEGTVMVKDIDPGSYSSQPRFLTNYNGDVYFCADDPIYRQTLFKTDGTETGTVVVLPSKDFTGGRFLTVSNNKLYFAGSTKYKAGLHSLDLNLTLGLDDNEIDGNSFLAVFPNPVKETVTITNLSRNSGVTITDVAGKKVYSSEVSDKELTISVVDFENGVYIIHVENKGVGVYRKIVVNK